MNKIFEGAKFGDKFLTRGGEIAILQQIGLCTTNKTEDGSIQCLPLYPILFTTNNVINCGLDGCVYEQLEGHYKKSKDDIVSRYNEPIDEKKLDELANKNCTLQVFYPAIDYEEDGEECAAFSLNDMRNAYKAGYKKAIEG